MGVEIQPGGGNTAPEIIIILEQQRVWLERQPEDEKHSSIQYQEPGVPIPEEVEEPHLGGEVEEDCGAGGQGDTWWLGKKHC